MKSIKVVESMLQQGEIAAVNDEQVEQSYAQAIELAQKNKNYLQLSDSLCALGNIYIKYAANSTKDVTARQHLLIQATALYNCAINAIKKASLTASEDTKVAAIRTSLANIEKTFLDLAGIAESAISINLSPYNNKNTMHQQELKVIREKTDSALKHITQSVDLLAFNENNRIKIQYLSIQITEEMKDFIVKLWQECIATIAPPCRYAVICFGSMARGEMTPYSDFEWAILIEDLANWPLYLVSTLDVSNLGKITDKNAIVLTNDNKIYIINNEQVSHGSTAKLKCQQFYIGNIQNRLNTPPNANNATITIYNHTDSSNIKAIINNLIKRYFKTLAGLLYLKVINLGETILTVMNIKHLENIRDRVTLRGFTFDGQHADGCKTPFGNKHLGGNTYELVGTPQELAELQNKQEHPFLASEICQFNYITGEQELVKEYQAKIDIILGPALSKERQQRTLKLFSLDIYKFYDDLSEQFQSRYLDFFPSNPPFLVLVKYDLYRALNIILDNLGLYFRLSADATDLHTWKSTWKKIAELSQRNIFNPEAKQNLEKALAIILALRLYTYINHGCKREQLLQHSSNEIINECLIAAYKVILPFQKAIICFIQNKGGNYAPYLQQSFLDDTGYTSYSRNSKKTCIIKAN